MKYAKRLKNEGYCEVDIEAYNHEQTKVITSSDWGEVLTLKPF